MAAVSQAHDPVSALEFGKALQDSICRLRTKRSTFLRLGLAVSGGVDSMALAYLWKTFFQNTSCYRPYRAFIVDHGLRPGSADEAKLIVTRIETLLDIPSQVITLNWTKYGGIDAVSSIETTARRLRYQALAQAAHKHGIHCILFGHHADDVVETALHRLTMRSQGSGLVGFKRLANIPECSGLYGLDNSGGFDRLQSHARLQHYIGGPEVGGVKIARPLLGFSKSRLLATCESAGVGWIEDKTNQDVTLTQRNVIRSMLKEEVLPTALRKPSILHMIRNVEQNSEQLHHLVRKMYDATEIKFLDLRTGFMELYLPSESTLNSLLQECPDEDSLLQAFARFLQQLAEAISPDQIVKLNIVLPTARILLNELLRPASVAGSSPLSFGRVKIDRVDENSRTMEKLHPKFRRIKLDELLNSSRTDTQTHIGLRLYRSAFADNPRSATDRPESITLPALSVSHQARDLSVLMSEESALLWDGRWWISIKNYTPVPLRMEALDHGKMQYFQDTMAGPGKEAIKKLWKEAANDAFGQSKWTIPALVCDHPPPNDSMIPPANLHGPMFDSKRRFPSAPNPTFEIYKYSGKSVGIGGAGEPELPGKMPTTIIHSLSPDTFSSDSNLSKRPESERHLRPIPQVHMGKVDAEKYPMPNGPFIVAIPTMRLFLNRFWADNIHYDIRYKWFDLPDMENVSRYRLEKPVMIDGMRKGTVLPNIVGERFVQAVGEAPEDGSQGQQNFTLQA